MLSATPLQPVIPVADLDRAKHFYEDALGVKVHDEHPEEVGFDSGGQRFSMYVTPTAGQAAHTLATWEVDDLDAEMAGLRSHGVAFEDYEMPGLKTVNGVAEAEDGMRAAWFKDSEGNILCLHEKHDT
ncbi:VOC family protein [Yinghuangia seranimata]|uniref:VOC family protein n=1 Tax=Yinghuangia seranimata TaxID=408067 RepID=UPI00248BA48D|nr:VOC family protein [Yinghuangia seranimata]MDI2129105.1 VOC family protein [Yinghuangia seranimata]